MCKKILLLITLIFCSVCSFSAITEAAEAEPALPSKDIIMEIQEDISLTEFCDFAEISNATINYSYTLPVYTTDNISNSSTALADTLKFSNEYVIPAVDSNGKGIGMFWITFKEKWNIYSYWHDFDLISAIGQLPTNSFYLLELPTANIELGILTITNNHECYRSIINNPGTKSIGNTDTKEILDNIKEAEELTTDVDSEGTASFPNNNSFIVSLFLLIIIAAGILSIYLIYHYRKFSK